MRSRRYIANGSKSAVTDFITGAAQPRISIGTWRTIKRRAMTWFFLPACRVAAAWPTWTPRRCCRVTWNSSSWARVSRRCSASFIAPVSAGMERTRCAHSSDIDLDLDPIGILQEQLGQSGVRYVVDRIFDFMREQPGLHARQVHRVECNMIERPGARSRRRNADAGADGMRAVGIPLGDMNTWHIAHVKPVAGKPQRRSRALAQSENVAIEIARPVEIVGEHQVVFQLGQGH